MIHITAQMRVLVAIEPVDGRKGIDSLVRVCQERLSEDPISGCVFIFRSRRGTSIRLLSYDGQGYWLAQKRLSQGRFTWWPESSSAAKRLEAYEAQLLMVCVASSCCTDVAAGERIGVEIATHMQFSLAFQERLFHTAGQWVSSDIAAGRSIRKPSYIYAR